MQAFERFTRVRHKGCRQATNTPETQRADHDSGQLGLELAEHHSGHSCTITRLFAKDLHLDGGGEREERDVDRNATDADNKQCLLIRELRIVRVGVSSGRACG